MALWTDLDRSEFDGQLEAWVEMIETMHHGTNHRVNAEVSFTSVQKPLSESAVALVSTAGVHVADQDPFDVSSVAGDPSFRVIPDDVDPAQLRFTHTHYDTAPANEDPNVVFPIQRIHEYVAEGRLGSAAPFHVGMMGFNPDPTEIADNAAPEVAALIAEADVDVVLLIPG